jgi:hypothetical protein
LEEITLNPEEMAKKTRKLATLTLTLQVSQVEPPRVRPHTESHHSDLSPGGAVGAMSHQRATNEPPTRFIVVFPFVLPPASRQEALVELWGQGPWVESGPAPRPGCPHPRRVPELLGFSGALERPAPGVCERHGPVHD